MVNLERVYTKDPEVLVRTIDKELVIIPLGEEVGVSDLGVFHILKNETAFVVWDLIDSRNSVQAIIDRISKRFKVNPKIIAPDIVNFLRKLEKIKAIK